VVDGDVVVVFGGDVFICGYARDARRLPRPLALVIKRLRRSKFAAETAEAADAGYVCCSGWDVDPSFDAIGPSSLSASLFD